MCGHGILFTARSQVGLSDVCEVSSPSLPLLAARLTASYLSCVVWLPESSNCPCIIPVGHHKLALSTTMAAYIHSALASNQRFPRLTHNVSRTLRVCYRDACSSQRPQSEGTGYYLTICFFSSFRAAIYHQWPASSP